MENHCKCRFDIGSDFYCVGALKLYMSFDAYQFAVDDDENNSYCVDIIHKYESVHIKHGAFQNMIDKFKQFFDGSALLKYGDVDLGWRTVIKWSSLYKKFHVQCNEFRNEHTFISESEARELIEFIKLIPDRIINIQLRMWRDYWKKRLSGAL